MNLCVAIRFVRAFEKGAAPITLIDGDRLIDLLIEHEIGMRKEQLSLLKFEQTDFLAEDDSAVTE